MKCLKRCVYIYIYIYIYSGVKVTGKSITRIKHLQYKKNNCVSYCVILLTSLLVLTYIYIYIYISFMHMHVMFCIFAGAFVLEQI